MNSFRDYLAESEFWIDRPRQGDELDLEIAPDELIECLVVESDGETIVLEANEQIVDILEHRGMIAERIARYGPVGSTRGQGYTMAEESNEDQEPVEEDQFMTRMLELAGCGRRMEETEANTSDPLADKAASLAPVGAMGSDPAVNIDEGFMSEVDIELHNIARSGDEEELIDALGGLKGGEVQIALEDMMEDLADELAAKGMTDVINDDDKMIELLMDKLVAEYSEGDLDEAKYQGRKVELNKPKRGGSKKFYVYVKDPKSGNVRKISFGDPNMKIKKSNPARRKSFRARHNCDNPGPRTKARFWSCRAW